MSNAIDISKRILKLALGDTEFERLCRYLESKKQRRASVVGGFNAFHLLLVSLIAKKTKQKIVLFVSDELIAKKCLSILQFWTADRTEILRHRPLSLSQTLATSHELEQERLGSLDRWQQGGADVLIVTAAAALDRFVSPSWLEQNTFQLHLGEKLSPQSTVERLTQLGYERVRQVEDAGQFALRGDILDVACYEQNAVAAYRISFFDEEIDALRTLDLDTARSLDNVDTIRIIPVRELVMTKSYSEAVANEIMLHGQACIMDLKRHNANHSHIDTLMQSLKGDINHLQQGENFANLDRWLAFLPHLSAGVLDYALAQDALIITLGQANFAKRLDATYASHINEIQLLLEKGQLTQKSEQSIWNPHNLAEQLAVMRSHLVISDLGEKQDCLADSEIFSFTVQPQEHFAGREQALLEEIAQSSAQGEASYLFVGNTEADNIWQKTLTTSSNQIKCHTILANLADGLNWRSASLHIFGQNDIYGAVRRERRRGKAQSGIALTAELLHDLRPGEPIVHDHHGIGRYDGLVNMMVGNVARDYIKLSYAGDDTLFVPMDALATIQKYVQVDGGAVKLNKLGGTEWGKSKQKARESVKQLAYDLLEVFAHRERHDAHRYHIESSLQQVFIESFPYEDTPSQERVWAEIREDMASPRIMERLLCGDVGFGKTEMAFRALVRCVDNGYQAAMLAPTTVLSSQHYENLSQRLANLPIKVRQLSRFVDAKTKKQTLADLKAGLVDIVIGTHSLFAKSVQFKNLGLLVIDEEQRFGVDHKEKFKTLLPNVDVLTLTATPIPRTLHFSVAQIRDISVLEHGPPNRRAVQTYVMEYDEQIVSEAILRELSRGGQVFYLFNNTHRIEEVAMRLGQMLPEARIGIAHGQMGERQLEQVIANFVGQKFDILVCTTIIESGLDMPNVNTIIVEHADRLGLAQLYQIRGRVGRSPRQAYAYITYRRQGVLSEDATARLSAIRDFTELGSGIKIARRDLEVRGAGDLLGAEQSGHLDTVGYEMYCRLLSEAIAEARGTVTQPPLQASVELPLSAYIDTNYVIDDGERMDLYRRLAAIDSYASYLDTLDEMVDRYGETPKEALTLCHIAYIRSAAERTNIAIVCLEKNDVVFKLSTHFPTNMERLSRLLTAEKTRKFLVFDASAKPSIRWINGALPSDSLAERLVEFLRLSEGDAV